MPAEAVPQFGKNDIVWLVGDARYTISPKACARTSDTPVKFVNADYLGGVARTIGQREHLGIRQ